MIKVSVCIPVWNQEKLVVRTLDHIPRRDDLEVLVRDDGSSDRTLTVLREYKDAHPELNMKVYANSENMGMYYTSNRLLEDASGEYFNMMNSDDYVLTDVYSQLVDCLDGSMDVLCMDLQINDGHVWPVNEETARIHCAQVMRFIRKDFVKGIEWNERMRAASDWYYNEALMKRDPRIVYSRKVCYMYNFPREGSLVDLRAKGVIGE